jgi:pyruvate formate lyase activating enzyme
MRIGGMQKLTLLDYPGKVTCTVFLSGCNLRCPYCHNPDLVLPERIERQELSAAEVLLFLENRRGKLDGVCISGGEPTIQQELPRFAADIRSLGYVVKLDTNGTNPGMLRELLHDDLLDYVAMDIKNSPEHYAETCGGVDVLPKVQESASLLLNSALDYEFRTTVCKPLHTEKEMAEIGRWLKGAKRYFLQSFEDSGDLVIGGVQAHTQAELMRLLHAVLPYIPNTQLRGI